MVPCLPSMPRLPIVRTAPAADVTMGQGFRALLKALLAKLDLLYLDPLDPAIRKIGAPLLAKALGACARAQVAAHRAQSGIGRTPAITRKCTSMPRHRCSSCSRTANGRRCAARIPNMPRWQTAPSRFRPTRCCGPSGRITCCPPSPTWGAPASWRTSRNPRCSTGPCWGACRSPCRAPAFRLSTPVRRNYSAAIACKWRR